MLRHVGQRATLIMFNERCYLQLAGKVWRAPKYLIRAYLLFSYTYSLNLRWYKYQSHHRIYLTSHKWPPNGHSTLAGGMPDEGPKKAYSIFYRNYYLSSSKIYWLSPLLWMPFSCNLLSASVFSSGYKGLPNRRYSRFYECDRFWIRTGTGDGLLYRQ